MRPECGGAGLLLPCCLQPWQTRVLAGKVAWRAFEHRVQHVSPWRGPSQARGVPMSLWEGAEGTSPFLEIPVSAASPTTEGVKGFKLSGTWNYGKHEGWIVIAVIKTHQHISKATYSQQKTSRYVHKKIWQIISFSKICVPQACYKMKRYLQGYETCWQFCDVYMTCYIKCYKTNLPYQKAVEPTEGKLKKL